MNQFPHEEEAIDKYFDVLDGLGRLDFVHGALKWFPFWLCWIIVKTGVLHLFTLAFRKDFKYKSSYDFVCQLTDNKDLRQGMHSQIANVNILDAIYFISLLSFLKIFNFK